MSVNETVGVKVKADDAQATAAFSRLERAASGFADGLRKNIDRLKDFAGQLDSAAGSMRRLLDLAKGAGEMRQVEASFRGTGAELGRLQRAVDGTVDKMRLMGFANKAMRGEFHLTQTGMEQVLKAADALNDQGFGDTIEIAENMARALKTGSTRSLREYGITVDETRGKQAAVNDLMETFKRIAAAGGPEDAMNKRFEQFNARLTDAVNRLRTLLGTLLIEFVDHVMDLNEQADLLFARDERGRAGKKAREMLLQQNPEFAKKFAAETFGIDFITPGAGLLGDIGVIPGGFTGDMVRGLSESKKQQLFESLIASDPALAKQFQAFMTVANAERDIRNIGERFRAQADAARGGMAGTPPPGGGMAGTPPPGGGEGGFRLGESQGTELRLVGGSAFDAARARSTGAVAGAFGGAVSGGRPVSQAGAGLLGAFGGAAAGGGAAAEDMAQRQARFDEIMTAMADRQRFAGAAFGALADGVAASVGAAIDGSESIGKAFARAAGAALKATAVQASVSALWETAKGFAALAVGSPGAAAHFKAAAIFAATAVAAGAGAAAFGGGAGASGAAAGRSGGGAGGFSRQASGGGGSGQNITIIQVGDVFGRRPEDVASDIEKARRLGKRTGRVIDGAQVVRFAG